MDVTPRPRPRRRRPPTRGLLFGAPLDRTAVRVDPSTGLAPPRRPDPVPIALIGESTPVAPPRVVPFGAMAASWPLDDRPARAAPGAAARDGASSASSAVPPERRRIANAPLGGIERRQGGLSTPEWERLLGR